MEAPCTLLFPRDVLSPRLVDEHFRPEANAARELGIGVELIDHDAIVAGEAAAAAQGLDEASVPLVYRGWMIPPDRYAELEVAVAGRDRRLLTSADAFRSAHHLPRWYPNVAEHTPFSVWTTSRDLDEFRDRLDAMPDGAAVLKDYSKSEKHHWHEAMYIPDVRDRDAALAVAARFVELRGDYFDTGFVLRAFESLDGAERRTWWVDGELRGVTAHPDDPHATRRDIDLTPIEPAVRSLGLAFITVDVALDANGSTRIVEIGDGQVSDRPSTCDPSDFVQAILPDTG